MSMEADSGLSRLRSDCWKGEGLRLQLCAFHRCNRALGIVYLQALVVFLSLHSVASSSSVVRSTTITATLFATPSVATADPISTNSSRAGVGAAPSASRVPTAAPAVTEVKSLIPHDTTTALRAAMGTATVVLAPSSRLGFCGNYRYSAPPDHSKAGHSAVASAANYFSVLFGGGSTLLVETVESTLLGRVGVWAALSFMVAGCRQVRARGEQVPCYVLVCVM